MLSEIVLKRYEELYEKLSKLFEDTDFYIRHRSLKKYENSSNRDILVFYLDKSICGIYVGKDTYKIWMDNMDWYTHSSRNPSEKDDKGYYSIKCESLTDCVDEVKSYAERAYDFKK